MARKVLGRGLRALIPEDSQLPSTAGAEQALALVPLDRIAPNPLQPRRRFDRARIDELAQSIRQQGILQPIVVRRAKEGFEVIVGERRVRAARIAGLNAIPAVVKDGVDEGDLLSLALVENLQREDLDPIEEARAYRELMDRENLTQQHLADRVGTSREAVANTLRLLSLPPDIQQMVADGRLTPGHARAILTAPHARQRELAQCAVDGALSVREVERRARTEPKARARALKDADSSALETELEELLAARVTLTCRGSAGRLEIRFHSLDELDRIVAVLRRGAR